MHNSKQSKKKCVNLCSIEKRAQNFNVIKIKNSKSIFSDSQKLGKMFNYLFMLLLLSILVVFCAQYGTASESNDKLIFAQIVCKYEYTFQFEKMA